MGFNYWQFGLLALAGIAAISFPTYYIFKKPSVPNDDPVTTPIATSETNDSSISDKFSRLKSLASDGTTPSNEFFSLLDELSKIDRSDASFPSDSLLITLLNRKNDIVTAKSAIAKTTENYKFTLDEVSALERLKTASITCFGDITQLLERYSLKKSGGSLSPRNPDRKRLENGSESFDGSNPIEPSVSNPLSSANNALAHEFTNTSSGAESSSTKVIDDERNHETFQKSLGHVEQIPLVELEVPSQFVLDKIEDQFLLSEGQNISEFSDPKSNKEADKHDVKFHEIKILEDTFAKSISTVKENFYKLSEIPNKDVIISYLKQIQEKGKRESGDLFMKNINVIINCLECSLPHGNSSLVAPDDQAIYANLQVEIISKFNHFLERRLDDKILSLGVKDINKALEAYNGRTIRKPTISAEHKAVFELKKKFAKVLQLLNLIGLIKELLCHPEYFDIRHLQKQVNPPERGEMVLISLLSNGGLTCFVRFFKPIDLNNNYELSQFFLELNRVAEDSKRRISFMRKNGDDLATNVLKSYREIAEDPLLF